MKEPKYIDAKKVNEYLIKTVMNDATDPLKHGAFNLGWRHGVLYAAFVLQNEPAADISRWISVTERLPEEICDSYWVCTDSGYQCECRWTNANRFWPNLTTDWHWNIFDIPQYTKVVAWMPLPYPYKGGEDE